MNIEGAAGHVRRSTGRGPGARDGRRGDPWRDRGREAARSPVARELLDDVGELPERDRRELDARLRAQLGSGLEFDLAAARGELERVLKRGRILNEREYRAVLARTEAIYADPSKKDELGRLTSMLSRYDADHR